jgi:DNA-binding XRE family transcriptional regulator
MKNTFVDKSIKYYRKKLKIKQSILAQKLGITSTDMSFIENKKLYPPTQVAEQIADILEIPIGKIYSEEELNLIIFRSN